MFCYVVLTKIRHFFQIFVTKVFVFLWFPPRLEIFCLVESHNLNFPSPGKRVQRIFFGSEHGKGEADGETGVIGQAVDRAVAAGTLSVRNASDLYSFCRSGELTKMTTDSTFRRDFILVGAEDIQRDRPETDVKTVPGTRKMHQVSLLMET